MVNIPSLGKVRELLAKGKGNFWPTYDSATGYNPGTPNTQSAYAAVSVVWEETSVYGVSSTELGLKLADIANGDKRLVSIMGNSDAANSSGQSSILGVFYKLGTLVTTATGDQFTHDAATFPILRKVYGQASQAISLLPLYRISTALTTTLLQFQLRNAGSTVGYTDQDGNVTVGNITVSPYATAAVTASWGIIPLNDRDCAIRDISNINVSQATSAGAVEIWGFEPIASLANFARGTFNTFADEVVGGLGMSALTPGAASSGTATAKLGIVTFFPSSTTVKANLIIGVENA